MKLYEKYQTVIIAISVFLGLVLGQSPYIHTQSENWILPFLIVMLFGVFLQIPLEKIGSSFKNVKFTLSSLLINFLLTPLLAGGLGYIFLGEYPELWLGFVMLMVTPCTDWYLVFTSIARGNVPLSLAVLPLNLVLQLLLLPLYLLFLTGEQQTIDSYLLFKSVLGVLVMPLLLAYTTKGLLMRTKGSEWLEEKVFSRLGIIQFLFLNLAIMAMFASQGKILADSPQILLKLLGPILLFFGIIMVLSQVVGRLLRFRYEDTASLTLTTMARNSPIALAIAVTAFPDQPLISLVLIIGPLIELPVLAVTTQVLLRLKGSGLK